MPSRRLSRRTVLRGLGATVALPLLDVMPSAASGLGAGRRPRRLPRTGSRISTSRTGSPAVPGIRRRPDPGAGS